MRIRTTRQAREIRAGINIARNRDGSSTDFTDRLYQFPLMQRAYQRTKNKPPHGVDGLTRRAHNEGGSIVRKFKPGGVFVMPADADPNDTSQWQELGQQQDDGYQIEPDEHDICEWGTNNIIRTEVVPHRMLIPKHEGYYHDDGQSLQPGQYLENRTTVHRAINFTILHSRPIRKLVFGIYRLPGDRPLIHKGKKP